MSKTKIEKQLSELIEVAKGWRTLAAEEYGDSTTYESGGMRVWCYFAVAGNHTAVDFKFNGHEVKVSFHSPEYIESSVFGFSTLAATITIARSLLHEKQKEFSLQSEAIKEENKQKRIEHLKNQLKEIESHEASSSKEAIE